MTAPVPRPPFACARIAGGGRMGLSLALALRARAAAHAVDLVEADPDVLQAAREAGIQAAPRAALLPGTPDAVFLAGEGAVGPNQIEEWARLAPLALVQDLAALQRPSLEAARRAQARHPELLFVGAHPLLDSEDPAAPASSELFLGLPVALCPLAGDSPAALTSAERLWRLLGAMPVTLSADEHDRWLALTSHLPFVAATALAVLTAGQIAPGTRGDLLVGSGFLQAMRPVAGPGGSWARILARNGDRVAPLVRSLARSLDDLAALIETGPVTGSESGEGELGRHVEEAAAFHRRLGAG